MKDCLFSPIEQAAFRAWPALEQIELDGWVIRFSEGYTKRANSVNPIGSSTANLETKVRHCEQLYAERGLPCLFRLTPCALPGELDSYLEQRGYTTLDPSLVLYLDLAQFRAEQADELEMRIEALDPWLGLFCKLKEQPLERHQTHRTMLTYVPPGAESSYERLFASLSYAGQVMACAGGVLEGSFFGLFDLITALEQRNRGYGTALVSGMLRWAQERGATNAYLQVMQNNVAARRLYTKLGYEEAYPYWYRVPPAPALSS